MTSVQLQKLRISVKAYEAPLLDSSCSKIIDAVKASGIEAVGPIPLPTKTRRYCVLTSPHVNKPGFTIELHWVEQSFFTTWTEYPAYASRCDPRLLHRGLHNKQKKQDEKQKRA